MAPSETATPLPRTSPPSSAGLGRAARTWPAAAGAGSSGQGSRPTDVLARRPQVRPALDADPGGSVRPPTMEIEGRGPTSEHGSQVLTARAHMAPSLLAAVFLVVATGESDVTDLPGIGAGLSHGMVPDRSSPLLGWRRPLPVATIRSPLDACRPPTMGHRRGGPGRDRPRAQPSAQAHRLPCRVSTVGVLTVTAAATDTGRVSHCANPPWYLSSSGAGRGFVRLAWCRPLQALGDPRRWLHR
jgi:hypothetical protein